jgi:hypothetical protein
MNFNTDLRQPGRVIQYDDQGKGVVVIARSKKADGPLSRERLNRSGVLTWLGRPFSKKLIGHGNLHVTSTNHGHKPYEGGL